MAGFSEQRQQLRKALLAAGLDPDAAGAIANILGNSAQGLRHAGPVEIDSTPPGMRQVGPADRKLKFPHLDFRPGDPDHRQQRTEPSEDKPPVEPEPNVVPVVAPQQTDAKFHVQPGALTNVAGDGQVARVNVNNIVAGRPAAGLPVAMLDAAGNRLVGKALRAQVGPNDGTARLQVVENNTEVVWNLEMLGRADYNVVTKVEYLAGKGLEITYERIKAWDKQLKAVDTIPVEERSFVTEIVDDAKGLRARRRIIPVFESRGDNNSYFNTFRVGTFEDDWPIGTLKTITQVWPTSHLTVDVMNYTHEIADTPGEKYVLFAPLTESATPAAATPPEIDSSETELDHPQPITTDPPEFDAADELVESSADGVREPVVEWVAIEIQNAEECTAFNSLNGQTVDELPDYDVTVPSALSYETDDENAEPCLRWRSHLVTVLTDVALTSGGLVFSRKQLYVLGELEEDPITIPITDCPDPPPCSGPCESDEDCGAGCYCCDGECQAEPC